MASSSKKPKLSKSDEKNIFDRFSEASIKELKLAFVKLCTTPLGALQALNIHSCNAKYGFGKRGRPFTKADVEFIAHKEELFYFGTVFLNGFRMLESYLEDPKSKPSESYMELILSKLLEFLESKDRYECFRKINEDGVAQESDLAVRLAEHFFSKLSITSSYKLDKYYPDKYKRCPCCEADIGDPYADTSIGNNRVWHGSLDIVLGTNLPVKVVHKDPDSPGEKAAIEAKHLNDLENPDVTSQLLAQTIVFSFTQKKNHPECSNFLIPSIGVNKDSIMFFFYDCEHDVLLRSMAFPLYYFGEDLESEPNLVAILAAWFVMNYKFLCTGCTDDMKPKKAKFFEFAGPMLPIYEKELTMGGVKREWTLPCVEKFVPINLFKATYAKSPNEYLDEKGKS